MMNRSYILILLFLVFGSNVIAQDRDCDSWRPDRKLTWAEFTGKPDRGQSSWANTACAIGYSFEGNRDSAFFNVECCFESSQSWVKENPTELLLRHEQAHFDLAEVYARELRKKLKSTHLVPAEATRHVPLLYKGIMRDYNEEQRRYDKETDHSRDEIRQKQWEKQIAQRLKDLEKYSNSEIRRTWNK